MVHAQNGGRYPPAILFLQCMTESNDAHFVKTSLPLCPIFWHELHELHELCF